MAQLTPLSPTYLEHERVNLLSDILESEILVFTVHLEEQIKEGDTLLFSAEFAVFSNTLNRFGRIPKSVLDHLHLHKPERHRPKIFRSSILKWGGGGGGGAKDYVREANITSAKTEVPSAGVQSIKARANCFID